MSKDVTVNGTTKQSSDLKKSLPTSGYIQVLPKDLEQTPPEWNLNPPDKRCEAVNKNGIRCGLPINHKERFGVSKHSNGVQHRGWD